MSNEPIKFFVLDRGGVLKFFRGDLRRGKPYEIANLHPEETFEITCNGANPVMVLPCAIETIATNLNSPNSIGIRVWNSSGALEAGPHDITLYTPTNSERDVGVEEDLIFTIDRYRDNKKLRVAIGKKLDRDECGEVVDVDIYNSTQKEIKIAIFANGEQVDVKEIPAKNTKRIPVGVPEKGNISFDIVDNRGYGNYGQSGGTDQADLVLLP